jgi:F420-non-reducing hydrogenase small subunit
MPSVKDQGAQIISALSSIIDSRDPEEIERILDDVPDLVGLAYRFGLPASLLERRFGP